MSVIQDEIAAVAARLVVEEGLDFGSAKRKALAQMDVPQRSPLPDNEALERAVEDYIAVFCADEQASELRALRLLAARWMRRLQPFKPYVSGAVWSGIATRRSDIYLQLFCEDSKMAEIELINQNIRFSPRRVKGLLGDPVDALSIHAWSEELGEDIGLHLMVYDLDDLRRAPKTDSRGRAMRGSLDALEQLIEATPA
ncbi:MAG: hypothetical protein EBR18_05185 [Betaproteobacteria bacterium]|nr:hypothetical protein [Betaproteobacteria bacterium]